MTGTERKGGTAALVAVLDALLASAARAPAAEGAALRQAIGALRAGAADAVEGWAFGAPLANCFTAAVSAGATFDALDRVRQLAQTLPNIPGPGRAVAQTAARLALVAACRVLAATQFVSRQDVDAALARINLGFDAAEDFAADRGNATVYRALVALHAATVRDLTQRGRQLPRLVTFSFSRRVPTLTLACRLYGDGARAGEIAAENRVVHPLFAPSSGRALAA